MAIRKRGEYYHIDAVIDGVRYREALHTTDRREALRLEKDRIAEIKAGKAVSASGQVFARLPFSTAASNFLEDRHGRVAPRTVQFEKERLSLSKSFSATPSS